MAGLFSYIKKGLGIEGPDVAKVDTSGSSQAYDKAASDVKSVEQLASEGKDVAGQTANYAASQAAKNASNAVANAGGGKLARALAASQAAADTTSDSFNSNLQHSINTAAQQNQAKTQLEANKAASLGNAAQVNAANEQSSNNTGYGNNLTKQLAGTAAQAIVSKLF